MSISQAIAPHLPHLRRFARALTGSQRSGDAYVVETLEAIVADPDGFGIGDDAKTSLYRLFLKLWGVVSVNNAPDAGVAMPDEIGTSRRLEAISLRPRIALLLTALEGFSVAQAAATLTCSQADVKSLLDQANAEIAAQISTDVLIIEDEPLIALDLQNLVEELGHRVIDVARTHREALAAIQTQSQPGLILADIQLADGSSGLEAVNEILESFEVPVIFITAYPERFLTGAPPEPAFLIAKPFSVDTLRAVISQVLFFDRKSRRRPERSTAIPA
ncbi:response regulator [Lichenifustis flavocetrariae]|uniref:Response regulator n=1 Tax=Lichenifustis flavocetrariae TaxID=2949735 RepID=A0AA41Z0G3_9HYPH|nr:response regulator [Lichenifustis flavocetrariae]MCW6507047.1 response regulator [Lichenifustis flavocetrariae]